MFKKLMETQNQHMDKAKQKAIEKQEAFNATPKGQALLKKQEEDTKRLIEKSGVYNVDERDIELLRTINPKHLGSGLISFGTLLQGNGIDSTKIDMTKSLIAQNWFMIRQNDKIISLLNQIANK